MIYSQHRIRPSNLWQYGRIGDGTELAIWYGNSSLPLSCHFHREFQITAVLKGCRRFLTATGVVTVGAGEALVIPPGLPHQAIGLEAERTLNLNFYLTPEGLPLRRNTIIVRTPCWLQTGLSVDSPTLIDWIHDALERSGEDSFDAASVSVANALPSNEPRIADIASTRGMSREGFIRSFRRSVGMTPHAYRLAFRLNRARELLAANVTPAQAAADAGFADQSHMGRHFRRSFGVTPGIYRCAVRT
ncbi:AraC family transcriptional regulator [Bradyrhizobium sp. KBS0727]|jgi:AraC-like DNA-binding protein/mannose-6-phosphate isomerase-like protein (cupin superfamily)|nr:AraC family transcriptional regulator [Bradyrhizobium sp. KBS0725]QDW48177.1 AraC family transcriptional regulator [Bradyrhizobium sp. KBS0727]